MAVIEAYVTNLGKYNEGELASSLLKFPTTREEVQEVLKQILLMFVKNFFLEVAQKKGRTK